MSTSLHLIFLISFAVIENINSQQLNPLDFFPHHLGDYWEYLVVRDPGPYIEKITYTNVDTLPNNNILVTKNHDTTSQILIESEEPYNIYFINQYGSFLTYKLSVDPGSYWWFDSLNWGWMRYIGESTTEIFGFEKTTKIFEERFGPVLGDTVNSGVLLILHLAETFGFVYSEGEFFTTQLVGCVIDGDTFGIVTDASNIISSKTSDYALYQNYPNPFNNSTLISYYIPEESNVTITVFNTIGEEIGVIYDGIQKKGSYKLQWQPKYLASGIYVYQLRSNKKIINKKLMYIK